MCAAVVMAITAVPTTAGPTVVNLSSATSISFQDEGTLTTDNTTLLSSLDGSWAPRRVALLHTITMPRELLRLTGTPFP